MDAEKGNLAYTNYGTDVYSAPTPPPPYEPGNIQNPVDKGQLRGKRNAAIQKYKIFGSAQVAYGLTFFGIALAQIIVAAQGEYGFPLLNVGPILMSILMIISGVLAVLLWKKGEEHKDLEEAPKELRQLLCGIWTTNHIANCSFIGWSTAFCFMSVAACANSSSKNYRYCVPEVDANIALAALCGTLGVLCLLFIIPSYYMYGCNYKAFNFKKGCCNLD